MSVASKTMLGIGGGIALSIGFSAVAAGGISGAVALTGLKNFGILAGHGLDIGGSIVEFGGESLVSFSA